MTDDCMGCRKPGQYSHAAYCPESRVEELRRDFEIEIEVNGVLRSRLAEAEAKIAELREALGCEMDDTRNACGVLNDELDRVNKRLADKEILLTEAVEYGTDYKQAYGEAMANYQVALARLAEAEDTIERAGRCLVMSNNGAVEALTILRGYKQPDSAAEQENGSHG